MRLIVNHDYNVRRTLGARMIRICGSALDVIGNAFRSAWFQAFPIHLPTDGPGAPAPIAKASALREGAVLSEDVEAIAEKHIA